MKLSVIVPAFNEAATIGEVLKRLIKVREVKEIVVVNDGSTDKTAREIAKIKHRKVRVLTKKNGGKGSAIRLGLSKISGDYVLIQDADLEYDPDDIHLLIEPIKKGRATVVFGSRFLGAHSNLLYWHRKGNEFLNFLVNVLYNTTLSDMETCYKIMPTRALKSLQLQSNKFDIEPEITCKLLKNGFVIFEVPISYVGRNFDQGKKITWRDGVDALKMILWHRFTV
jgi:glycosyltransferase involved in cell wall biosynthesis